LERIASIKLPNALRGCAVVVVVTCCHRTMVVARLAMTTWMSRLFRATVIARTDVLSAEGPQGSTRLVVFRGWWLVVGG
jgi:hypothetical protein